MILVSKLLARALSEALRRDIPLSVALTPLKDLIWAPWWDVLCRQQKGLIPDEEVMKRLRRCGSGMRTPTPHASLQIPDVIAQTEEVAMDAAVLLRSAFVPLLTSHLQDTLSVLKTKQGVGLKDLPPPEEQAPAAQGSVDDDSNRAVDSAVAAADSLESHNASSLYEEGTPSDTAATAGATGQEEEPPLAKLLDGASVPPSVAALFTQEFIGRVSGIAAAWEELHVAECVCHCFLAGHWRTGIEQCCPALLLSRAFLFYRAPGGPD